MQEIDNLERALCDEYDASNCYELAVWLVEYNLVPVSDRYFVEKAMTNYEIAYEKKYKVVPSYYDIDSGSVDEDVV